MSISEEETTSCLLKLWVQILVIIVCVVGSFSLIAQMKIGGWIGLFSSIAWGAWCLKKIKWQTVGSNWRQHTLFLSVLVFCLLSFIAGPHSFIDSFSYRIPQLLFWLQEGHPWSVPNVDMRINQMPHVWPFLSSVFYLPFGAWGLAIPNMISLFILYLIIHQFILKLGVSWEKGQWIALIFMASPVMVMQAPSNDNVLSCVTLLMVSFFFCMFEKNKTSAVIYSSLSFALACGIKPQYVTLAPLWLGWFFTGWQAPFRSFKWRALIWLFPLILVCSPLPTFTVNQLLNGSFSHPVVLDEDNLKEKRSHESETELNASSLSSYTALLNQMMALPVNPLSEKINQTFSNLAHEYPLLEKIGLNKIRVYPLLITEKASISLFASLALFAGLALAANGKRDFKIVALFSLIALIIAIQITKPSTLGRSFVGFFILMLPLCFFGLGRLPLRLIRSFGLVVFLMGIVTIIINPASPLWPVSLVQEKVSSSSIKSQLDQYGRYSKRHTSGSELVKMLPQRATRLGVVVDDGTPLAELWMPFSSERKIFPYSKQVKKRHLIDDNIEYIIVKKSFDKNEFDQFLQTLSGKVVAKENSISYMSKGIETWFLVRIN